MRMSTLVPGTLLSMGIAIVMTACSGEASDTSGINGDPVPPRSEATINVDSTRRLQRIVGGWSAAAQICHLECPEIFPNFADRVAPVAVDELGLTRLRVEVRSGFENPRDFGRDFVQGAIPFSTWKDHFYEIVNDNGDAFTIDPTGFQFTPLDLTVERVVLPIRERLAARGESLYVNLNYVDFDGSSFEHFKNPEEYAEFILVMFQHLDHKYGLVPDALEIILEPDNAEGWSGVQIGRALVAAADRLADHGYTPHFIAPSTMSMAAASSYFDDLMSVEGASQRLTDFSYHRYRDVSEGALRDIADRAASAGVRTAMLEHLRSGYENLHRDLALGRNSAWQRFGLAWPEGGRGSAYLVIDPQTFGIRLSEEARFLSQYFRSIRPGDRRVGASSTDDEVDPLAFVDPGGKFAVVVKAEDEARFTVGGLPAGRYDVGYTTGDSFLWKANEVTVEAGVPVEVSIPGRGVLSLRQK